MTGETLKFTVPGPPRTKKNHGATVVLPSKEWTAWRNACWTWALQQRGVRVKIDVPVSCRALFYRDALRGDAVGYYQGLADVLEFCDIVQDDKWIVDWDGSRMLKDAAHPRVEVTLTALLP